MDPSLFYHDDTKGIVFLYNIHNPTFQYPPIRGVQVGDYLGKSRWQLYK